MKPLLSRIRRVALHAYSKYLSWSAQREASRYINSLVQKDRSK